MEQNILVVDDEKSDLKRMTQLLKQEGFNVTSADSSAEVMSALTGNQYALILLDIMMPDMTGYDLLKVLRGKAGRDTKMLFVSIVPKSKVDLSDADGFIQKPFSDEKFIAQVKGLLGVC